MSGHSKWHSIKHKKASVDAKKGKLFTRLIKEISVAARLGGGEVDANPRLRVAVQAAKDANMPQNNVKRAIMKGTGELPGQSFESVTYEGYGPGGVAVFVEVLTDNKNRTVADLRHIFSKQGGTLAEAGSVQWIFERKGCILINREKVSEDQLLEVVLEAGAEDMETEGDTLAIYMSVENFETVKQELQSAEIPIESATLTMIPQTDVHLESKQAEQMLRLMDALDEHEDVANLYANFTIDESQMETLTGA
ncbi:YebC/PmpR family DNA-binding transcriptional regulator [Acidobacteria bacterium AH-259-D05]|nr:YebC/PmpR family DNA-binding transcriptional regulator [Acidobacteria bacterium AH-259-D05]